MRGLYRRVHIQGVKFRRAALRGLLLTGLALVASGTLAQTVYKWVDENGETHYSQTLPPERVQQEHARIASDGRVEEEIERAPSAEERAALAERIRAEQDAEQRALLQAQQDRLFLAAYPTEEAVADSIDARREVLMAEFEGMASLMEQARERMNQWVAQAAALERNGQPVPEHIRNDIARAQSNLANLNQRRRDLRARMDGLDDELVAELARFRRLTGTEPEGEATAAADPDDPG